MRLCQKKEPKKPQPEQLWLGLFFDTSLHYQTCEWNNLGAVSVVTVGCGTYHGYGLPQDELRYVDFLRIGTVTLWKVTIPCDDNGIPQA